MVSLGEPSTNSGFSWVFHIYNSLPQSKHDWNFETIHNLVGESELGPPTWMASPQFWFPKVLNSGPVMAYEKPLTVCLKMGYTPNDIAI